MSNLHQHVRDLDEPSACQHTGEIVPKLSTGREGTCKDCGETVLCVPGQCTHTTPFGASLIAPKFNVLRGFSVPTCSACGDDSFPTEEDEWCKGCKRSKYQCECPLGQPSPPMPSEKLKAEPFILGELRAVLDRLTARGELDPTDHYGFVSQLVRTLETYEKQSAKYGPCWKESGLDARSTFVEANAKHWRLRHLLWKTPPEQWNVQKIVETLRDRMLYDLMTIRLLELAYGPINEDAVQREVDKT